MYDDYYELAAIAAAALALAAFARYGDARRMRRSDPDAVGLVPWTTVFFAALLIVVVAGTLAVRIWIGR